MSSSKDGSGKGDPKRDPKAAGKPGSAGLDPKKPTPIIDLKATEVKNKPPAAAKPAATAPSAGTTSASTPTTAKPAPSTDAKSAAQQPASSSDAKPSTATTAAGKTGSDKTAAKPVDAAKPANTTAKSDPPKPATGSVGSTAKSEPEEAARSGGSWSMFTHLAAGFAGGALVLFGAQPIEQNVGMELLPRAAVPAEYNQRLAALEARPVAADAPDVTDLTEQVRANDARLAELAGLQKQINDLAAAQKAAAAAVPAASATSGGSSTADLAGLQQRLAKLEKTFETLVSATSAAGQKTDAAQFATISGAIADVETSLNNQIAALRQSVSKELETRVAKTAEASAAAKAGTQRLDRELATVKTEAARLAQRTETIKAAQDGLGQAVRVAREEAAKLNVQVESLKSDVLQQFKSFARPQDVDSALKPLASKLTALESQLGAVVESETARKANAKRIVMALELGNLKRVLNRGGPYAAELAEVKRVTGGSVDFSALEKFQTDGVPTNRQLRDEFSKLAYDIIRADNIKHDATTFERLLGSAKSLVRVRRADLPASDSSAEAIVARIEKLLKQGNLSGALEQAKKLSEKSIRPARSWLERVAARANVDRAVATIESQLKSSLGSSAVTKG